MSNYKVVSDNSHLSMRIDSGTPKMTAFKFRSIIFYGFSLDKELNSSFKAWNNFRGIIIEYTFLKMSHLNFSILAFSTNFCLI